jgi:molybdopterin converting factor small subunit
VPTSCANLKTDVGTGWHGADVVSDDPKQPGNGAQPPEDDGRSTESGRGRLVRLAPPWEKGRSGNPSGRPKTDKAITKRAREMLPAQLERMELASQRMCVIVVGTEDNMEAVAAARAIKDIYQVVEARAIGRPKDKPPDDDEGIDAVAALDELIERFARRRQAAARPNVVDAEVINPPAPPPKGEEPPAK